VTGEDTFPGEISLTFLRTKAAKKNGVLRATRETLENVLLSPETGVKLFSRKTHQRNTSGRVLSKNHDPREETCETAVRRSRKTKADDAKKRKSGEKWGKKKTSFLSESLQ